jgi:hypothetical protein
MAVDVLLAGHCHSARRAGGRGSRCARGGWWQRTAAWIRDVRRAPGRASRRLLSTCSPASLGVQRARRAAHGLDRQQGTTREGTIGQGTGGEGSGCGRGAVGVFVW